MAQWDSISVNIGPIPREREKLSKQSNPHLLKAQLTLALLLIKYNMTPRYYKLPNIIALPDHRRK